MYTIRIAMHSNIDAQNGQNAILDELKFYILLETCPELLSMSCLW